MAGTPTTPEQAASGPDNTALVKGAVDIVSASLLANPMDSKDVPSFLEDIFSELQSFKKNFDERFPDADSIPDVSLSVTPATAKLPSVAPAPSDVSSASLLSSIEEQAATPLSAPEAVETVAPAPKAAPKAPKKAGRPRGRPKAIARVDDSIQKDVLVCLEDNKKVRDLAEHLAKRHGMTPADYRKKHGLPDSYPMLPPAQITKKGTLFDINPKTGALVAAKS